MPCSGPRSTCRGRDCKETQRSGRFCWKGFKIVIPFRDSCDFVQQGNRSQKLFLNGRVAGLRTRYKINLARGRVTKYAFGYMAHFPVAARKPNNGVNDNVNRLPIPGNGYPQPWPQRIQISRPIYDLREFQRRVVGGLELGSSCLPPPLNAHFLCQR